MLQSLVHSQFLPGESWLHQRDPRCKLLILGMLSLAVWLLPTLLAQMILAGLVGLAYYCLGPSGPMARAPLIGVLPIALTGLVLQAFWGLSGLEQGGLVALHLVELALLAHLLVVTTSPLALCDGLESLLAPLAWVGLPRRDLALAFTLAWRFLPMLALESQRLLQGQMARGAYWEDGPWARRWLTLQGLLFPLLLRCFRQAKDLSVALEARGYGSSTQPTRLFPLQWGRIDTGTTLSFPVLLLGLGFL